MNTINCLVIDDEKQARNALRDLIVNDFPYVHIIAEADGVATAIAAIDTHKPDLIFLDINLGDGTGFQVLQQVQWKQCMVIFTTAYDQYAVAAFKLNAIDYLLKPVMMEDLQGALEKVHTKLSDKHIAQQLAWFQEMIQSNKSQDKKIVLKDNENIYFVKVHDIIRCQAEGTYTEFYLLPNQKITVSKSLKEYEDLLLPFDFIRVHHSHLINKEKIQKYLKSDGGSLLLEGNHIVPVSQRRKAMVMSLLQLE
ncbi:MAG: response regulator transcription factor [Bacteroidetes bacterium]|jgi:two-component system LytT family response regulator|nr:response regulator transcription factor [Bacteroidota bacterium]HQW46145.1 LytTR family DNA-binding domain-containing protein [Chitinophagaceae bacterium]MBK6818428.1 response regulator transcription factor [Bacteroidota bacterium]MBK7040708.1 response regulator transcription factor [Bacteroidota bacterium]MBK8328525.1 response regulator transcription factor [Bacteroidota bacterium]